MARQDLEHVVHHRFQRLRSGWRVVDLEQRSLGHASCLCA
jgi:hypothetical protein